MDETKSVESIRESLLLARASRKSATKRFANGTMSFDQLLGLSESEEPRFKSLRKLKVVNLLQFQKGWSKDSISRLLFNNGFSSNVTLSDVKQRPRLFRLCSFIINNSAPDNSDVETVKGWPWRGSVLAAVNNLPGGITIAELGTTLTGKATVSNDAPTEKTESIPDQVIDDIVDDISEDSDAELPPLDDGELDGSQLYELLGMDMG